MGFVRNFSLIRLVKTAITKLFQFGYLRKAESGYPKFLLFLIFLSFDIGSKKEFRFWSFCRSCCEQHFHLENSVRFLSVKTVFCKQFVFFCEKSFKVATTNSLIKHQLNIKIVRIIEENSIQSQDHCTNWNTTFPLNWFIYRNILYFSELSRDMYVKFCRS